jgi:hypothetical protein
VNAAVHHALLGLACLSLFGAGHRLAARLSDRPLDRVVAAAVFATAAAVGEAVFLGLFDMGADTTALSAAAAATYLAARLLLAEPESSTGSAALEWLRSLGARGQAAAGALTGLALLVLVWSLRYPTLGFDGAVYHLPEIARWVVDGNPGSTPSVSYLFPFANYPVTNEVLLTWAVGVSRSFVPVFLWSQVLLFLTAAAAVLGLRSLGVKGWVAGLAAAALLSTPVLVQQLGTPDTDLPALCWLVCCAALAARAQERPRLLFAAVVAAGLALGTKTSPAPLILLVLGIGVWRLRGRLRPLAGGLALAVLAAVGVGGLWYLRNALDHGSPLWPFQAAPGGDPVPHVWSLIDNSLLERPGDTLRPRLSGYVDTLAGAALLAACAPFAWLVSRRRAVVVASAASAVAILIWAAAPSTGQPDTPVFDVNVLSTTRYALPAFAAAAVALALAASARGRLAVVAQVLLAAALGWNLIRVAAIGPLSLPGVLPFLLTAALGAAVGFFAGGRISIAGDSRLKPVITLIAVAALGVAGSISASGLAARNAEVAPGLPGAPLVRWATGQPGFEKSQAIYFVGTMYGSLAGDELQHRLVLLPPRAPCPDVRSRAATGLLVVAEPDLYRKLGVQTAAHCVDGLRPSFEYPGLRVYGSLRASSTRAAAASAAGARAPR